jgi:hypothetical protein
MVAVQPMVVFAGGEPAQRVVNGFDGSVAHDVKGYSIRLPSSSRSLIKVPG